MSNLDAEKVTAKHPMILGQVRSLRAALLVILLLACRDKGRGGEDSARGSLPPVFPSGPASSTNWDMDAGPVMLVSLEGATDSAAVILPEVTDSTIASVQGNGAPVAGLVFDLFGRGGKVDRSTTVIPIQSTDTKQECDAWPLARIAGASSAWRIGFASGHVQAIRLDSIEAMPGTDSAALAVSLAETAAMLANASDPTFSRLPFRVRSAYTFRLDSVDLVIADVVRSVNEEANPRIEHLLMIGEKRPGSTGKYNVAYYSRTAGAEETTQATEVLAAVRIGPSRKPAVVVNIEHDDGRTLGLIERVAPGQWRSIWRSAYTDC